MKQELYHPSKIEQPDREAMTRGSAGARMSGLASAGAAAAPSNALHYEHGLPEAPRIIQVIADAKVRRPIVLDE